MRSILKAFVQNTVFANLLLVMIVFAGIGSLGMMVRELLPSFAIENVIIRVPYPGAGPEEVEEGISLKIEDAIQGVDGMKRYSTTSGEGLATAIVEVKTGEDVQIVKDRIADRINAIQTFPDDAEKPTISEMIIRRMTLSVALSGDLPEQQMREMIHDMKDDLMRRDKVSQVEIQGAREYEISIELSEETLRKYGLTFQQVSNIVRNSSLNMPGGTIRSDDEEIKIRTMGRNYVGKEYADIVLISRPNGTSIRLGDVATIRDGFTEDMVVSRYNGRPAMSLWIYNSEDEDALEVAESVKQYVKDKNEEFEQMGIADDVQLDVWLNASRFITERIDLLVRNGIVGLILVFLLLWIFLDLRLAFWVSLGIPISLSGAMFLMWVTGATINMISLFAMIMVLGIIVDDAIVVGEAIYVHRRQGEGPVSAAVNGTLEVAMPVIAAVTTSCVAFVPMFFIEGIMGKFIAVIPTVVICALIVSLAEGLIILPAHLNHLPDINNPPVPKTLFGRLGVAWRKRFRHGFEYFVAHGYRPFLRVVLGWRYASLAAIIAILMITMGLVKGGFIKYIFFPNVDTSFLFASVEFPEGTPGDVTLDAVKEMEDALWRVQEESETLSGEDLVVGVQSNVGLPRVEESDVAGGAGVTHIGQIIVEMLDAEERGIYYRDIIRRWEEEIGQIPGALNLKIIADEGGPPGSPIEVWLLGNDLDALSAASNELKDKLGTYSGVFQIDDDFRPGKRELRARLKPEARTLGLTTSDLAAQLRGGFYGDEARRVQRGRDEVKVWIRYPEEERRNLSDVEQIRIRTPEGHEVPLASVADIEIEPGYTTINRVDSQRRITVSADVFTEIANADEIITDLQRGFLPQLMAKHPGIKATFEGTKRDSQESFASLKVGFPLAILAIYLIIATIFRSYIQPMIIMITIPFGIIGAIWGHMLLGYTLTIMSLFGMVALTGVVVNDAIILIEAINVRLAKGLSFADAVVDGGARRFRAILLTTTTTVGGLTPLIMEDSFQAQFLIPMALTIAAGVAFATLLTLIVIPCLLFILNDLRLFWHFLWKGERLTREQVEPATHRPDGDDVPMGDIAVPIAGPAG